MDNSEKNVTTLRYKLISFYLSADVSFIGLSVLFGWILDIAILKSLSPNWVSMKANTAICFLLSGIVLMLLNKNPGKTNSKNYNFLATILSILILLIGALTFLEYIFNLNLGIDELIFKDDVNAVSTSNPGRMAPSTALCFMFFGIIFLLIEFEKKFFWVSQILIHVCGTISYFAFLGYIYEANLMKGIPSYTAMAFSTAVCILILTLGFLFLRPSTSLMKHISDNTYASHLFRLGLPLVLFFIIVLGWIHLKGEEFGFWDGSYGTALMVLFLGLIFAIMFWFFSIRFSKYEKLIINKNEEIEAQNEEYKQINEELFEAKEKAEQSEQLKSAFLSNMSHEVRTPLNKIIGYSDLLTEEKLSKTDRTEYISQVNINSTRLLNLINDILDLSRIESGQVVSEIKQFDINALIYELHNQHKKFAELKKLILINIKESAESEVLIKSNENAIYQILNNLINNAIKYTETGSISFGYKISGTSIEFFVKDTGIGISPEYASKMFERFSQENPFSNREFEGVGLGLSIVKALVDKLNGKISYNSIKGKGSGFNVIIPIEKIDNNEKQNDEVLNTVKKRDDSITLLVVEDDEASFVLLKIQISHEFTCKIIHAVNGLKAIEAVKAHPEITCVLMDMNLPGMDGCETTEKIKEIKKELPVFALTAASMDREKEKAFKSGCNEFFSKPVDLKVLYNMILKYK